MDPQPSLLSVPFDSCCRGCPYRPARPGPEVVGLVRHPSVRQAPPDRIQLVSQTGPRRFAEVHHLSIRVIVARLSAKPSILVESGTFVGRLGDQDYELGSTEAGLARAIRRMSGLQRGIQSELIRGEPNELSAQITSTRLTSGVMSKHRPPSAIG